LEKRINQMFLMKFEYPEFINKEAREISVKRSSKSKAVYKQKKRKRKNETEVSYRGVLAELIFTCILVKEKIEFKSAPLVAEKPVAEPDFIVGKYRIDVKAKECRNESEVGFSQEEPVNPLCVYTSGCRNRR
jgi:hypothetical protein